MKRFLLFAAAAMIVASASAQYGKKPAGMKAMSSQKALPAASFKKYEVAGQKNSAALIREQKLMSKKFDANQLKGASLVATNRFNAADLKQSYNAKGFAASKADSLLSWTMLSTTVKGTGSVLVDVVPNDLDIEGGVAVTYTQTGNTITIPSQLVMTDTKKGYYFFIEDDGTSADGSITLELNDEGAIVGNYSIGYFVYSDEARSNYLGYWTWAKNISYKYDGQAAVAPAVEFYPNNLVLFAGLGVSGYSYNNNLVMMGAYAPVQFSNVTTDEATAWDWSIVRNDDTPEVIRSTEKNFTLNTVGGEVYNNLALVGVNETAKSDSCKWGVGNCPKSDTDPTPKYTNLYAYAGSFGANFQFSDDSYATMTTQDPDGDLTFYTNWGTPDKTSTEMSKIYVYQGKPSTPLYFEGVTLPMVGFSAEDPSKFTLHIAIRKCTRNPSTGRVELGDIIAESDATAESINDEHAGTSGLTAIEFKGFYVEDEFGMSTELDYLFIDEEFLIEIDGWNNGTFSGVLGSQDITGNNKLNNVWFEKADEEGSKYAYTSWKPTLFVGLLEAAYGYLYTTDNTDITFAVEGGQASLHVLPMLNSVDGSGQPSYRLFIESITVDGEELEELPSWLKIGIANENYDTDASYDLILEAAALEAGVSGHSAQIVFFQEGAQLVLNLTQGTPDAINTVVKTVKNTSKVYDLNGRQITNGKKGLIIRDGKKIVVK